MRTWLLVLALVSSGCLTTRYAPPPVTASAAAKQAYALDGVVQRIDEFQTLVIDLATSGQMPTPTARIIVKWTVAATTTIGTTPNGWQAAVQVGWLQVRDEVARIPQLAGWVPLLNTIIGMGT